MLNNAPQLLLLILDPNYIGVMIKTAKYSPHYCTLTVIKGGRFMWRNWEGAAVDSSITMPPKQKPTVSNTELVCFPVEFGGVRGLP